MGNRPAPSAGAALALKTLRLLGVAPAVKVGLVAV